MDFAKYEQDIIKTMQDIIKIRTVEDTPVPNGPFGQGNKECLEYMLNLCSSMGFKVKNLDGYCGYAEIGSGDSIFGIIGHLDVVPEGNGWTYPPYSAKIVDGIMYGRGTWDDKGPAVMALYALKALMDDGYKFNKRVRMIFGCNEESGSRCIDHYLEKEGQINYGFSPDADFPVIYGEKTINNIMLSGHGKNNSSIKLVSLNGGVVINAVPDICLFTLDNLDKDSLNKLESYLKNNNLKYEFNNNGLLYNFTVHGKSAHGSLPFFGINAISYSIVGLSQILDNSFVNMYAKYINLEYTGKALGCYACDEYGDIAVNVGIATYKDDNYEIKINSRLPFNTNTEKMVSQIKETLKNTDVNVTLMSSSNGFIIPPSHPMIQVMLDAYRKETGDYKSEPMCIAGGTYARSFNNCVGFGPEIKGYGEIRIHNADESIPLAALKPITTIYYEAIKELLEKVDL